MADVPQIKVSAKPPIRTDALVMLVDNGRTETDGIDWGYLERVGFEAKVGSHVMVPGDGDLVRILVGMGDRAEVTHVKNNQLAPDGVGVSNYAFDVTPNDLVTAIITEKGVARAPYIESLKKQFEE